MMLYLLLTTSQLSPSVFSEPEVYKYKVESVNDISEINSFLIQGGNTTFIRKGRFTPFPIKPLFICFCSTTLLKTLWKKNKLLLTSNFFFSHSVFHHFEELSAIFMNFEIVVFKLFFQFRRV